MSCTGDASDIGLFSTGLWQSLGSPDDISSIYISGYVTLPSTLGTLNAYIASCYSGVSGAYVCPDLDYGSFAIIGMIFTQGYYLNLMKANAGAGGAQKLTQQLIELSEGDSRIRWTNPGELAKVYLQAAQDAQAQLKYLVKAYNDNSQGGNIPRSINYLSFGVPYYGYGGGIGYYGAGGAYRE